VLQGEQQEHRNMPLDDAMAFVSRGFSAAVEAAGAPGPGQAAAGKTAKHPEDILAILGFLLDHRPLSVVEYDKALRYLTSQRAAVLKAEYGDHVPPALAAPAILEPAARARQEELQQRVLAILERGRGAANQPAAIAPGLQAAIDSLVKTGPNLLNSLKLAAPVANNSSWEQGSPTKAMSSSYFESSMAGSWEGVGGPGLQGPGLQGGAGPGSPGLPGPQAGVRGGHQPQGSQQSHGSEGSHQPHGSHEIHGSHQPLGSQQPHGSNQPLGSQQIHGSHQPQGSQQPHGSQGSWGGSQHSGYGSQGGW
jgi:hypothetical protein